MRKYYSSDDGYVEKEAWEPECWIYVEEPNSEDYHFLREELGVPDSFLQSCYDVDERARFDREDDWQLTIIRIPSRTESAEHRKYRTLPLGIITKDDIILTICPGRSEMLSDYIAHTRRKHINVGNKPDFILRLIFSSTYWFLNYLREISQHITHSIKYLKKSVRNEDLFEMMKLQNSLVFFNTSLRGNSTLVERINKQFTDDCDPDLLDDVNIEIQQAMNTVNIYTEILDSSMDTFASVISNNVNQIMKKMTSVSIILMLPTLIASFYGMNVAVAFGAVHNAFWFIIIFSILLALLIYLWLRKINWI